MKLQSQQPAAVEACTNHIQWEEVDCPLCGSETYDLFMEAPEPTSSDDALWFAIVRCRNCHFFYTNPRPTVESIGRFYSESYRPHKRPSAGSEKKLLRRHPALPRWLLKRTKGTFPPDKGRLLDFGCGAGFFLEQMQRCGWDVAGIDNSALAADRLRERTGLPIFEGSLPHPGLKPESFDVVTMWHSLEHVHQPMRVVEAAWDLLAPGGKLLVETPNIESLPFRWFGASWCGLELPRHLCHFTPVSLSKMLMRCGFEVEAVHMVRHSSWLRMSARLACARGQNWLRNRLRQWKPASQLLSLYHYLRGRSDGVLVAAFKPAPVQYHSR